jgi:hypothetical protein
MAGTQKIEGVCTALVGGGKPVLAIIFHLFYILPE